MEIEPRHTPKIQQTDGRPPIAEGDLERAKQSYRGMLGLSSLPDSFRYLIIHPERHCLSAAASVNTSLTSRTNPAVEAG